MLPQGILTMPEARFQCPGNSLFLPNDGLQGKVMPALGGHGGDPSVV